MPKLYFISDLHFGHSNIINLAKRPFADVYDMNHRMILNWNSTVLHDDDEVIYGGDFAWSKPGEFFHQLRGKKTLIKGNHDHAETLALPWKAVHTDLMVRHGGKTIHVFHYPMADWNLRFRGGLHFHGHTHGGLNEHKNNRIDISAENMEYRPWDADDLITRVEREKV